MLATGSKRSPPFGVSVPSRHGSDYVSPHVDRFLFVARSGKFGELMREVSDMAHRRRAPSIITLHPKFAYGRRLLLACSS